MTQNTESWEFQSAVSPPLENVATRLYNKLSVAFNFLLMRISDALGHHSITRTKNHYPAPDPSPARPHSPAG